MFNKTNFQVDLLTNIIYKKLILQDHILVKIDSTIDFSFVYEIAKDNIVIAKIEKHMIQLYS